ncbi:MAG: 6-bladed beta-propeller [Balneolaceae bacterium]|nr:6-bladed beta-propeller [Balneolaceae bacterium]
MNVFSIVTAFFFSLTVIIFASCENKNKHPDITQFPAEQDIDHIADLNDPDLKFFPGIFPKDTLEFVAEITDPNSDYSYDGMLLYNSRILIDHNNNIYVQDGANTIVVYDSTGHFQYSIGRPGRGPGEFLRLFSFDFNSNFSKLYALDAFEIEEFELINGKYEYKKSYIHGLVMVEDICVLENNLYISGFNSSPPDSASNSISDLLNSPISQFRITPFEFQNTFGYTYKSYHDWNSFNRAMSKSKLACNEQTQTVVEQKLHFPFMFGYTPEGERKWISKFENFIHTEFTETSEPILFESNQSYFHRIYPFKELNNSPYEMLQIGYHYPFSYLNAKANTNTPQPSKPTLPHPIHRTILVNTENGKLSYSENYSLIGALKDKMQVMIDVVDSVNYQNRIVLYE